MLILKCKRPGIDKHGHLGEEFYECIYKCSGCDHYQSRDTTHDGGPSWDEWCDLGHSTGGNEKCPDDTSDITVKYQNDYFDRAGRGRMV